MSVLILHSYDVILYIFIRGKRRSFLSFTFITKRKYTQKKKFRKETKHRPLERNSKDGHPGEYLGHVTALNQSDFHLIDR